MAEETKAPSAHSGGGDSRPERSGPPRGPRPGGGGPGGPREGGRKYFRRKKVCKFCVEKIEAVNYKDVRLLAQFVAESGKITPRRLTGVCTPHQRRLSRAIKQARNIALLPFAGRAQ
jgi:small subunit ribosomal protein S18